MIRFLRIVLFSILILSIFPLYTSYKASAGPIPPGVHLAGIEMGRIKDREEIRALVEARYGDPVAVYFAEKRLVLRPDDVDFAVDVDAMIAEAEQFLQGEVFMGIALRHLLGIPQERRDVPVRYTFDADKLDGWLTSVAQEHNRAPQSGRALLPQWQWVDKGNAYALPTGFIGNVRQDWQWTLGSPGQTLRLEESREAVLSVLADPEHQAAHLVLETIPPPPLQMDALSRALDQVTSDFPGFASIYVQDLTTGEEAMVDAEVAFSGMSTMKIAIVAEAFRQLTDDPDTLLAQWMDYALGESSNAAANSVLSWVGGGSTYAGGQRVTEMMRTLGFRNSFIQTGYEDNSGLAAISTPANQQTEWNTNPDAHLQSTAADMGRFLAEVYRCWQGEGRLLETFGAAFTQEECGAILFYMSHDEFQELVWGGLPRPKTSWIVHKHGFVNEAHSDVALVWGPTGPYVISVYLWRNGWMDWDNSNSTMTEVSRIVWNYFAFKGSVAATNPPEPPRLAVPPYYVPLKEVYDSWAANYLQPVEDASPEREPLSSTAP